MDDKGISRGNPFEDRGESLLFTGFDESWGGYADKRTTVQPNLMKVPSRYVVMPATDGISTRL